MSDKRRQGAEHRCLRYSKCKANLDSKKPFADIHNQRNQRRFFSKYAKYVGSSRIAASLFLDILSHSPCKERCRGISVIPTVPVVKKTVPTTVPSLLFL